MDEADRDDRVALLDGLIDQLEFVVFDIRAGERGRAGHDHADQRRPDDARVGVALHVAIPRCPDVPRTAAYAYPRGPGTAQQQTAW